MDREQYDALPIMEQLEYINSKLSNGESVRSISKKIGMSKTTIRDRFIKIGYVFNADTRQYDKDNTLVIQEHKSITKTSPQTHKEGKKPIKDSNTKVMQKYKDDLLQLIDNKDDILKMLEDYKSNTKIIELPQLDISSLPGEMKGDIINKSIKVYAAVYELFDSLCKEHNSIKKQDLLSLALLEFYNKYK